MREPAGEALLLAWSGGKDSALALREVKDSAGRPPITLLTTVTQGYQRISMHGVREELLRAQAAALGLALAVVYIPRRCSDGEYRRLMERELRRHRDRGCRSVVFGDIFLQGVREYRERNLAALGMNALFPLWGRDTGALSRVFVEAGFRAVTSCVDTDQLAASFAGRLYDRSFLEDLPSEADPCGENGEFHTFVFDGPLFSAAVRFAKGKTVLRDKRFQYCDLLPDCSSVRGAERLPRPRS